MKTFIRIMSVVITLTMLVATVAVAFSVSALAEEVTAPKYVQTFTKDNFKGFYSYNSDKIASPTNTPGSPTMSTDNITFNDDGSFTIDSNSYDNVGVRAIFSIDEGMKKNIAAAKKAADDKYQANLEAAKKKAEDAGKEFDPSSVSKVTPGYSLTFRVEKSLQQTVKADYMRDTFVFFGYIMKDGSYKPCIETGGVMYKTIYTSFPLGYREYTEALDHVGGDTTYIENETDFDNIEAIYFEAYHWNKYNKAVTFSGLTIEGSPEIPEFPTPDTGDDKTAVVAIWDPNYAQSYGGNPDSITYSADNGATQKFNKKNTGYMKWEVKTMGAAHQWQAYYFFDRDQFNYGITVANKEGGSHKIKFNVDLQSCVDNHGNPVKAQVILTANFNQGGYKDLSDAWQDPGTSVDYIIDTKEKNIDLNSIQGFRIAIQNYWYYDANGKMVQYPLKKENDPETNENGDKINYGTGVDPIYIKTTAVISPIETIEDSYISTTGAPATTTVQAVTTQATQEIEGAGYHFFDFNEELRYTGYGNAAEQIKYITDENDPFYGGVNYKSPTKVRQQHQSCWGLVDTVAVNDKGENVKTVIPPEIAKKYRNIMRQALAYAKAPGAPGLLKWTAKLDSGVNPANGKQSSIQMYLHIMCFDSLDDINTGNYVNPGNQSTYLIDVSELEADMVKAIHPMAQNYATVWPNGNPAGCTNIDATFSAITVAGLGVTTTARPTEPADDSEAKAIYDLYQQIGQITDFSDPDNYAILEKFLESYSSASDATRDLLESKYSLTMDDYGTLLELFNDIGFDFGFDDDYTDNDDVDTGAAAAPISALFVATAAAFVIVKSKKK